MKEGLSIHYGEIALKGKLRSKFERLLINNIKYAVGTAPHSFQNRLFLEGNDAETIHRLSLIPGVSWIGRYISIDRNTDELENTLRSITPNHPEINLDVKRVDKSFENTSLDIKKKLIMDLGIKLLPTGPKIRIEIMPDSYIINYDITRGIGGVPSGSAGRIISLFSGGIDSAVAPLEMMKRGCNVDLLHVYAVPDEKQVLDSKISRIAEILSTVSPLKLYMVPFHVFNLKVISVNPRYELVMFKRFLLKLAEEMCLSYGYKGISTGDSLSQVASQTLDNINAISYGIDIPVLRPLLSNNKEEIIYKAQMYGTYDVSIKSYKDCCSLVSKNPLTTSTQEKVKELENALDLDSIVKESLSRLSVKVFDSRVTNK
ncbi:MAG: hypothetical protein M1433_02355 [Candidatus Parvarchaeota archaeon]|nr:hypothetical protein [Candidatus Parvarchaeota archaeon]